MTIVRMKLEFEVRCWDGDKNCPADLRAETIVAMIEDDYWKWRSVIIPLGKTLPGDSYSWILRKIEDPKARYSFTKDVVYPNS